MGAPGKEASNTQSSPFYLIALSCPQESQMDDKAEK